MVVVSLGRIVRKSASRGLRLREASRRSTHQEFAFAGVLRVHDLGIRFRFRTPCRRRPRARRVFDRAFRADEHVDRALLGGHLGRFDPRIPSILRSKVTTLREIQAENPNHRRPAGSRSYRRLRPDSASPIPPLPLSIVLRVSNSRRSLLSLPRTGRRSWWVYRHQRDARPGERARSRALVALGDHQHHESHRRSFLSFECSILTSSEPPGIRHGARNRERLQPQHTSRDARK
jgi:hypothetical protein